MTRVVDLGEETGEEIEEKVRGWMKVERLRDGKTAEVMVELKGGMGKKKGRKATFEKLVEERAFEKERKKKVRLIKEGVRRKSIQQGSGPGDILNFGMYEGWRFGVVYICHPTYGEWTVDQAKPKMWKLKCFKFSLKRLADLERVLEVNITRVEMCEGLMEEMVTEEQQAVEVCERAGRQRVRWGRTWKKVRQKKKR